MTVQQQLIKEIEGLPLDAQKKVLKLVHFVKEELFPSHIKNVVEELEDSHLGAIAKKRSERKGKKVISLEEAERRVGSR